MKFSMYEMHLKVAGDHPNAKGFKLVDELVNAGGTQLFEDFLKLVSVQDYRYFRRKYLLGFESRLRLDGIETEEDLVSALACLSWMNFHSHNPISHFLPASKVKVGNYSMIGTMYDRVIYSPLYYIVNWYHSIYFNDKSGIHTRRTHLYFYSLASMYRKDNSLFNKILDEVVRMTVEVEDGGEEAYYIRDVIESDFGEQNLVINLFMVRQIKKAIEKYEFHNVLNRKSYAYTRLKDVGNFDSDDVVVRVSDNIVSEIVEYGRSNFFYGGAYINTYALEKYQRNIQPLLFLLGPVLTEIFSKQKNYSEVSLDEYQHGDDLTREFISLCYKTSRYSDSWEARLDGIDLDNLFSFVKKQSKDFSSKCVLKVQRMEDEEMSDIIEEKGMFSTMGDLS